MRRTACLACLLLAGAAIAGEHVERDYGYVYDLHSGKYLYTETHERRIVDGRWRSGTDIFYLPDGSEFGRKTLDFGADPYLPLYDLRLTREGWREGITAVGDTIAMLRQRPRREPETGSVQRRGLTTADGGMAVLLLDKLDALLKGDTIAFRVVAPSQLDQYKFRARRIADTEFEGRPAVQLQVDMDSMLKLFAGPLVFTIDAAQRRILEFRGITNVRDPATGKDYHVRISFYSKPPPEAPKNLPPLP